MRLLEIVVGNASCLSTRVRCHTRIRHESLVLSMNSADRNVLSENFLACRKLTHAFQCVPSWRYAVPPSLGVRLPCAKCHWKSPARELYEISSEHPMDPLRHCILTSAFFPEKGHSIVPCALVYLHSKHRQAFARYFSCWIYQAICWKG